MIDIIRLRLAIAMLAVANWLSSKAERIIIGVRARRAS